MSLRSQIIAQLSQVAEDYNRPLLSLTDDLPLLNSGLDSLCLAVVVTRLEDLLNLDPFSAVDDIAFPVTVGDFIRFYESAMDRSSQDSARCRFQN